ncbi:hypothetical protein JQ559_02515 [Bradyrhizobium viridifuturi]|jgi:hypothetical protein|uniref:hypothetical protein n=1 Tax=Bradyrhizobium TaxID=374 RepID=UPI0003976F9E|nr:MULTISPECIES: hypothetical protein [Bradyrhizobium]ERF86146.1 MAG: hypothetical protein C207_00709 [Bradyrhizobium sp. DFCI-1]QRI67540.1 hypothetical protein JQ507_21490 [Bradyrhizobium sp. PSBB068]MBR1018742.1 hypothetical protein [Bradyrhizobium viridifuturi]MBR1035107.1 hypothetical protein [Bradyrhizobium viridifuturi]MBR1042509.1 hypothetical protein [Bradyrhizobium viridifuturi]
MCEQCIELDKRIAHYTELAVRVTDERTLDGIARLLADLQGKKRELHPDTLGAPD